MERHEIIKLSKKNIELEELEKAKKILEKDYIISHGQYEPLELKKAINEHNPVLIRGHLLTGFDKGNVFVDSKGESLTIDKMVKAVIVEGLSNRESVSVKIPEEVSDMPPGDYFAILGKNEWDDISLFHGVLGSLRVGPVFLPPHSAIFNFLKPGKEQEKKKIVSMLSGVNINVYSPDNYIDNCFHEIGHLFWRDCLTFDEKKAFKDHFKALRPSAIYEYEWERETEEEIFCTIYKWYVKSILINKSFYNILEFEEPKGLKLLQDVFTRVARDRQIADIWQGAKSEVMEYLNPKFDVTSGKYLRKAGALDRIRDIELPSTVLQNIARYEGGIEFIRLEKAVVPVRGNRIDWENMEKARLTKYKSKKPDGKGGWIYDYGDRGGGKENKKQSEQEDDSYKGSHQPPKRGDDVVGTGDNLSDIFPDDIYSSNAASLYGHRVSYDQKAIDVIKSMKGNPDKEITIYRAVPKSAPDEIRGNSWVTITKDYASQHGKSNIHGEYKIISKKIKANDLLTDGDSIHEWGYSPK